jgi:hypothetical protein
VNKGREGEREVRGRPRRIYSTPWIYNSFEKIASLSLLEFPIELPSSANDEATNFNPNINHHQFKSEKKRHD